MAKKKKKKDKGREESNEELLDLEEELEKEYQDGLTDLQKEAAAYFLKFAAAEAALHALLSSGEITEKEYNERRRRKMLTGPGYDQLVDKLSRGLTSINQTAAGLISGLLPKAYAANSNWSAYDISQQTGIFWRFDLVDQSTVERLIKKNPKLLPQPRVNIPKDQRWNQQKIKSALTQGILKGDSVDKIAGRLQTVTDMSASAAIRNARTMTTAAENAGRLDRYEEAKEMGIRMKKTWVATLDDRTRDAHALLDGQTVDIDEPFDSILGPIMCPGDPDADPENVYNCRCTMITQIAGYERDVNTRALADSLGNMTYEEWKEAARERAEERRKE